MKTASEIIMEEYSKIVKAKYPELADRWPILAGYNIINAEFKEYIIVIFKDTGINGIISSSVAQFNSNSLGVPDINITNFEVQ